MDPGGCIVRGVKPGRRPAGARESRPLRATLVLVSALLLLPLAPGANATPACQTLDRTASLAHVHTETCSDSAVYSGYTYLVWWNDTYVQVNGAAGVANVYDANSHAIELDPTGAVVYDAQAHGYGVFDAPAANPGVAYLQAGAGDTQYNAGSACFESLGGGYYQGGPAQQGGFSQVLGLGNGSPLPCTDSGTQETLP